MTIFCIGQRGVPRFGCVAEQETEKRAWAVAQEYRDAGHSVHYFGFKSWLPVREGLYYGIELKKLPTRRSAFFTRLHTGFKILSACGRSRPQVVHIYGWVSPLFIAFIQRVAPESKIIISVQVLPTLRAARKIQLHTALSVTVHSRELQYKLLVGYGIRATYVPDGYNPPTLPQVPTKRWGLTSGRYTVIMAEAPKTVRSVLKQLKGRSTVVVLHEKKGSWKRLANEFPRLNCVGSLRGRSRQSVLSGALQVVLADDTTETETLLETMAAGVPVSSIPVVRYQELLGTTARFSQLKELSVVVNEAKTLLARRGRAAAKRAQQHFTWERSAADYLQLARPSRIAVPLDSVQPTLALDWQKRALTA